jgi:hypothetical protein
VLPAHGEPERAIADEDHGPSDQRDQGRGDVELALRVARGLIEQARRLPGIEFAAVVGRRGLVRVARVVHRRHPHR